MNSVQRWRQSILAASLLVAVITVWVAFLPVQMGGQTSYVIVNGSSMEPNFHYGDLVILRQVSDYQMGDVVAYRDAVLGKFVLHRIIGRDLDHFILKGDNNSWTDSYEPVRAELVGKWWLSIPGAGEWFRWLRTPLYLATIVGMTAVILMAVLVNGKPRNGRMMDKKRRHGLWQGMKKWILDVFTSKPGRNRPMRVIEKRRGKALVLKQPVPEKPPMRGLGARFKNLVEIVEVLAFGLGFVAIASLVLGIFAFTRPVRQAVPVDLKYQQTGAFSYSGTAPIGVYDTGRVTSGEPIFPDLTCAFNLQFIYTITGRELAGLNGTHQLVATVEENTSHWTRTIPLEAKTAFSGNTFGADVPVNLCFIQTIVTSMEEKTTLQPNFYSLTISPNVALAGKISGQDFQDTLHIPLVMQFDKVHTYIFNTDPTVDPLNSKQEGAVASTREDVNTLSLFGIKAPVSKLRTISVIGLSVSGIVLFVLGIYLSTSARRSQQTYIQLKYSSILVDVENPPLDAATPVTDVVTLDDLARLAERFNTLILHETRGHVHFYYAQGDRITYRYTVNEAGGGDSSREDVQ